MSKLTEFTVKRGTETEEDYTTGVGVVMSSFVSVSLSLSVCLSVCLKCSLTFESLDLENSFLVHKYTVHI